MTNNRLKLKVLALAAVMVFMFLASPFILFPLALKYYKGRSVPERLFESGPHQFVDSLSHENPYWKAWSAYASRMCDKFPESCSSNNEHKAP